MGGGIRTCRCVCKHEPSNILKLTHTQSHINIHTVQLLEHACESTCVFKGTLSRFLCYTHHDGVHRTIILTFSITINACFFLAVLPPGLSLPPSLALIGMSILLRGAPTVETLSFPSVPLNSAGLYRLSS